MRYVCNLYDLWTMPTFLGLFLLFYSKIYLLTESIIINDDIELEDASL